MRWIDTDVDRARWRATGTVRVHPRAQVGLEYNIAVGEVDLLATVFLMLEDERRPALFLGTSSDRIGSPEGTQCYYATVAKRLGAWPVAPYVSLNWSEWDDGFNVPFGAHIDLSRGFGLQPMYDGDRGHLLAMWSGERVNVTAIWAWFESAGLAVTVGF